jgi:hypothetical protein
VLCGARRETSPGGVVVLLGVFGVESEVFEGASGFITWGSEWFPRL